MLYTEDTYEVVGQPYFGHMRGRYTKAEIKEIDEYALCFGIELMPCIQVLAHLNSIFRWPYYQDVNDCNDILLVGEEKTYSLIENMLESVSNMFTSRNIHIGMDEAWMLGFGKYYQNNGFENKLDIFTQHMKRVIRICEKFDFKVYIWSDMIFQAEFGSNYESKEKFSDDAFKKLPKNINFVYWDYFHDNVEHYENMIEKHLELDRNIIFAGGAWKWVGFAPYNKWSFKTSKPALEACIKKGIKEVMVTLWGDNGGECAAFSMLPSLALYAETCYNGNTSNEIIDRRLKTCSNCNFDNFLTLDIMNELYIDKENVKLNNSSKYLLYNDVLNGLFDKHVISSKFSGYYKEYKSIIRKAGRQNSEWKYIFETLEALCDVLQIKCDLGIRLKEAYDSKNIEILIKIRDKEINILLKRINRFYEKFKIQWYVENKVAGFDVQEIRIGGLIMRLKSLKQTLNDYLSGKLLRIEELEQERLSFSPDHAEEENINLICNMWSSICTPNCL